MRPRASSPFSVQGPSARTWPALHALPLSDERPLVHAGVLVGALELGQGVDVGAEILLALGADAHDDPLRVDQIHDAGALADHDRAGVPGGDRLHAGADERRLGPDQRHRLTLHVRAHQGAVGVVVLEERDQRGRHRDQLLRRNVDVADVLARHELELAGLAGVDPLVLETAPSSVSAALAWAIDLAVFLPGREVEGVRHGLGRHLALLLQLGRVPSSNSAAGTTSSQLVVALPGAADPHVVERPGRRSTLR